MDVAAGTNTNDTIARLREHCDKIATIPSDDVQKIASLLQNMIVDYYRDVRRQAFLAFFAAFVLEIVAVLFFFYAAFIAMRGVDITNAALSAISGLLVQIMTAVVFYLYSQSAKQFAAFHICLERTNRYLLANAMVERLPEGERNSKRAEVITTVLHAPMLTLGILEGRGKSCTRAASYPSPGKPDTLPLGK
jgi:hypothetical protein